MDNINFYAYLRVSTTRQDFLRQTDTISKWESKTNITIPKENYFVDYYTGKNFDRKNYKELKSKLKENDYLVITEVDRLGRDWDKIKKEWQDLKDNKINIIIIEMGILSDKLPSEKSSKDNIDFKLIKEQLFTLMCYIAQKERENISQRTTAKLQAKKSKGAKLGRPTKNDISINNFINTLNLQVYNNESVRVSCRHTKFPVSTFIAKLKENKDKYNIVDKKELLNKLKEVQA